MFLVMIMNGPFDELSKAQITLLYDLLEVHVYKYSKNQEILPTIKNENIVGIILNGKAQIIYIEYNGNEIVVEDLVKDSVFGSNISSTDDDNCEIIAKEDTEVLVIDYNKLMNPKNLGHPYFDIFFRNMFEIITTKLRQRNDRIRILEKKQIRDKLLEYFEIEFKKTFSRNIYLPFHFKDLADYIAVNRSAIRRHRYLRH